jgi:hypothetical protein
MQLSRWGPPPPGEQLAKLCDCRMGALLQESSDLGLSLRGKDSGALREQACPSPGAARLRSQCPVPRWHHAATRTEVHGKRCGESDRQASAASAASGSQ